MLFSLNYCLHHRERREFQENLPCFKVIYRQIHSSSLFILMRFLLLILFFYLSLFRFIKSELFKSIFQIYP